MEFNESFFDLARRRAMTRSFSAEPVPEELLVELLDVARRVPSAGNTQGFDFVVLSGATQTERYWRASFAPEARAQFAFDGLFRCPVLVTVWADPSAYLRRYSEPDKAQSNLGRSREAWATPYWTVDASFAAMALQYAALSVGLGVLFFGMFDHAEAIATALRVPADREPVGVVALGWPAADEGGPERSPAPNTDASEHRATVARAGRSASRPRRPLTDGAARQVHFGGW